ncbi:hypothetical protein [Nocardia asteroides]|uniref:hypothetical protein n=1 Tax=Nocardia asteroides TaxID=1824 RepID=UPI001E3EAAE7|nr:hypothetical protein [Nocardia asteroides]UGT56618.1 hypothetical protein LTT85_07050 [Nocardia asteroides]
MGYLAFGLAAAAVTAAVVTAQVPCPWDPLETTLTGPLIYTLLPAIPGGTALALGAVGTTRVDSARGRRWASAARFVAATGLVMTFLLVTRMVLFALAWRSSSFP